ncbi:MAG: Zn-dependent hydrolase [Pseudomonadota bacterium]
MDHTMSNLRIDSNRLWDSLMSMAEIGATAKGGCNRQALTDEDRQGRELFVQWSRSENCSVEIDEVGNIFVRRSGADNSLPPVVAGSHLDTQPTGGKFDGVYGVLAGLEIIRTLNDKNIQTNAPLEVVAWTNEEGARFSPALLGSGVWSGVFDRDTVYAIEDKQGRRFVDELERIGFRGTRPATYKPIKAAFEVHIEQGPILEAENKQIGVLTGIQGCRWYDLVIEGEPCHAGPTPMTSRKDPFLATLPIMQACYAMATQHSPWGRATFGDIRAEPGSRNTVPERIVVAVDLRHPDLEIFEQMDKDFRELVASECSKYGLDYRIEEIWHMPVTSFDPDCVNAVRKATAQLGYTNKEMVSGAGHDSLYVATVAPTSMIFIPCENGISHNEAENATQEDIAAGCNVLLHAMLDMAGTAKAVIQHDA